jgi:hypothetical protein
MSSDRICGIVRLWHGTGWPIHLRGKVSEIMGADPTASHLIGMWMLKRFCMYRLIQYLFELMIKLKPEMQSCEGFEMYRVAQVLPWRERYGSSGINSRNWLGISDSRFSCLDSLILLANETAQNSWSLEDFVEGCLDGESLEFSTIPQAHVAKDTSGQRCSVNLRDVSGCQPGLGIVWSHPRALSR